LGGHQQGCLGRHEVGDAVDRRRHNRGAQRERLQERQGQPLPGRRGDHAGGQAHQGGNVIDHAEEPHPVAGPPGQVLQFLPQGTITSYGDRPSRQAASSRNEYRPVLLLYQAPDPDDEGSRAELQGRPQLRLPLEAGRVQGRAVGDDIDPVSWIAGRLERAGN
jgi:hypothetical protein